MDHFVEQVMGGFAALKSGVDTLRGVLGLYRDIRAALPADKQEAVTKALNEAEKNLQMAEAEFARGFGYRLCRCKFPPTPMLLVGHRPSPFKHPRVDPSPPDLPVHECPVCKRNDPKGGPWTHDEQQHDAML
jgi:hypothetical protein